MPRTSKKHFNSEFKEKIWKDFLIGIKELKTGKELDEFLNKYLSSDEKNTLEKRLALFNRLNAGIGLRQISREIDIMPRTIYFVKRGFKRLQKKKLTKKGKDSPKVELFDFPTSKRIRRWK